MLQVMHLIRLLSLTWFSQIKTLQVAKTAQKVVFKPGRQN